MAFLEHKTWHLGSTKPRDSWNDHRNESPLRYEDKQNHFGSVIWKKKSCEVAFKVCLDWENM